jgi:hypothetical protein
MNEYEKISRVHDKFRKWNKSEPTGWPTFEQSEHCNPKILRVLHCKGEPMRFVGGTASTFDADWADAVPAVIKSMVTLAQDKKKRELEFNVIQFAINGLEQRIQRLESLQSRIIPIDSFAPEPYTVLKPILITVHSVDGGFSAGWFDANIHFSGDNEDDAIMNIKNLILDFFSTFSNEPLEKLGPEPIRQLAVMKEYIQKMP